MLAKDPAICVTGSVDYIHTYYQQATIVVAPVANSAGIQNKVLEAMACAAPVIAPPQANSALDMMSGYDALVENNPPQISKAMLDILANSDPRHLLGKSGRRYVEIHHDRRKIISQVE